MSSFLLFAKDSTPIFEIPSLLERFKALEPITDFHPSQKILNISSPFGLNSKELFLNLRYKGLIVNKLSHMLYLTDLDGHLVNVEGSPIFFKEPNHGGPATYQALPIGVRIPSVHSLNLFMGCSLMVPLQVIIDAMTGRKI